MVGRPVSILVSFFFFSAALFAAPQRLPVAGEPVEVFFVKDVRPGMQGTGYSVFDGDKVEAFGVEILGVMKNVWGPRQDVILARVRDRVATTGVAAGMSGSPVYLDGKLLGAISLRMGVFTTEPIAGITPAELMMEIKELDESKGPGASVVARKVALPAAYQALLGGQAAGGPGADAFLTPIDTPLVFAGFHDEVLKQFGDVFRQMGVTPVQGGAGGAVRDTRPLADRKALMQALPPGAAVSGVLISGDLSVAGTGTVTYNDGHRVLAFGHPLFNYGPIDMPMAKSEVVTVLGSNFSPFKITNVTDMVGTLRQDRHSGLLGLLGERPSMIPVEANIRMGKQTRTYRYEVFQNPKYTPLLLMLTFFNTLYGINEYGDEATFRLRGSIQLEGLPEVKLENMFASSMDAGMGQMGAQPGPMGLAFWIADRFTRIFNNPSETPKVSSVKMDFEIIPERRTAIIENVWADRNEARAGETINLKVSLRPFRGERLVKDVQVQVPANAARGDLRILLSDAEFVNRPNVMMQATNRAAGLNQVISMINRECANGRLYISLLQSSPTAIVEDKVMPSIPSSVANVIDPSKIPGRVTMQYESSMQQESIPVDYVISGSQTITVTVK